MTIYLCGFSSLATAAVLDVVVLRPDLCVGLMELATKQQLSQLREQCSTNTSSLTLGRLILLY